ncbi:M23 family metallopeptidase [Corynebacterium pseudopelargi]|uniref:Peptidase family M23 n=1 Tax=Corynebacterium pseudopelargi TaxID=2080757 RepID=A0A3G6ITH4_9CORY|nr:M23 family metallopeptidase [Corynebacterium pseudopelargi]AZA09009.1 Peptidase family M23 [Corynebacterium pseudopelargi]
MRIFSALNAIALCSLIAFGSIPEAFAYVSPATGTQYPGRVTKAFDVGEHDWLPGHRGVDLGLAPGSPVVAAEQGTVAFAGVVAGTPVLSIDHPDGLRSTYQPIRAVVAKGDTVQAGQVIGILLSAQGEQGLHWGMKTGPKSYINPLSLLDIPIIRLKPIDS